MAEQLCRMRMKRSEPRSVTLRNRKNATGGWIDMEISVGSWVTMLPRKYGPHGVKRRKEDVIKMHWKAQVLGFVFSKSGKIVDEVFVAHAYSAQDMQKEEICRTAGFPKMEVNCICSSNFKEAVSARSITSVLNVHHISVGKLLFVDIPPLLLKENGIWFHKYHYIFLNGIDAQLAEIPAPDLYYLSKSFYDQELVTLCRCMLTKEIGRMLTERGGVRCGVKLLMPIKLFAYMFKDVRGIKRAPQSFSFQDLSDSDVDILFIGEWNKKVYETCGQLTESAVDTSSLLFRYRIPKQTLYCNFYVERKKRIWKNGGWSWIPLVQTISRTAAMQLQVEITNDMNKMLDVDAEWSLMECRKLLGALHNHFDFYFILDEKKVGFRRECQVKCKDCTVPHNLKLAFEK